MKKSEILEGVSYEKAKFVANNTIEYHQSDGTRVIRLYRTDIIKFCPDGTIVLDSGGYKTKTTKNRIEEFVQGLWILQENYVWYVI